MRKHLIWSWILALMVCPSLWAQDETDKKNDAQKTDQASDVDSQDEEKPTVKKQFAQLRRDHGRVIRKFGRKLREAETDEREQLSKDRDAETSTIVDSAFSLVAETEDDDQKIEILSWVVSSSSGDNGDKALNTLLTKYSDSPGLTGMTQALARPGIRNESALRQIIEKCSNHDVKGHATFALFNNLSMLKRYSEFPDDIKKQAGPTLGENGYEYLMKRSGKELDAECLALLETCAAEYKDVKGSRGGTLGEVASNRLFAMKYLQVGKVAPDIEGHDLDEVAFKLSDYRGKVVILDFWGDW